MKENATASAVAFSFSFFESDIVASDSDIKACGFSDVFSPSKTCEANNTQRKPNITAQAIELAVGE